MSPALRTPSRHAGRTPSALLAVVLALSAGLVGTAPVEAAPVVAAPVVAAPVEAAPVVAASARGGPITRSEVIWRAQYWVDHQPGPYDQGAFSPGPGGDHDYRRDCSGYVGGVAPRRQPVDGDPAELLARDPRDQLRPATS
ncbi:hypothetical protein K7G98_04985 [Saccharothrix sp. MB29]|nr:hypothetical protein [Saccharothrix sp. MB29]